MAYQAMNDDGNSPNSNGSVDRDYGYLNEDYYMGGRDASSFLGGESSAGASNAPVAARAQEMKANFQAGASKWFQSTKEWLMEKSSTNSERREQLLADQRHERHAQRAQQQGVDYTFNEEELSFALEQQSVPRCKGVIVGVADGQSWNRGLYRSISVRAPPGVEPGSEFIVALPTGESRIVSVPLDMTRSDKQLQITYRGHTSESFGTIYKDEGEEGDHPIRFPPEERLIEFYRKHNPEEREAVMEIGQHGLTLKVFDGEFGAHVHHAAFVGTQMMLAADDVVTSANGEPVVSKADFEKILKEQGPGDFMAMTILRKSPPPVQRCPADHALELVGPHDALSIGSECNRCFGRLWDVIRIHRCDACDWALCDACYESAFENINTSRNANRADPEWAAEYEEDLNGTLSFSSRDKGVKLRIFWETTGEWWLGEVASYHPERGYEIVYEEGSGENKQLSKQTIQDISKRTYRVLRRKPDLPEKDESGAAVEEDLLAPSGSTPATTSASMPLTLDEEALLTGIEADLSLQSDNK